MLLISAVNDDLVYFSSYDKYHCVVDTESGKLQ